MERLTKTRPDLAEKVYAGELSAHQAMIEAGFRKRTVTLPLEPKAFVAAIRKHFKRRQIALIYEQIGKSIVGGKTPRRKGKVVTL